MGRIIVRDLIEFAPKQARIVIADFNREGAMKLAGSLRRKRLDTAFVNTLDPKSLHRVLRGTAVVINSAPYHFNVEIMRACLAAGAHYVDLGGLFHMTRKQLKLHRAFQRSGLTALIGMGAAPGITNILSRMLADRLETVEEIHTRVASVDRTRYAWRPVLPISYSLQTILEEFSLAPAVFTGGALKFVEPMSGEEEHCFPHPIGVQHPMYTLHSEVATLPDSFREKGVREVSFKIAFDSVFADRVRFLCDLGFASHHPLRVNGALMKPIEVINAIARKQLPAKSVSPRDEIEIIRAIVKGTAGGKHLTLVADCFCLGMPEWNVGIDLDTGAPASIAAQMIAQGVISNTGVLPPERTVPVAPFLKELQKRGMRIKTTRAINGS